MEPAQEEVNRLGLRDDGFGAGVGQPARVGELCQISLVSIEVADGILIGDGDHEALPPFVGETRFEYLDARRSGGQRAIVARQAIGIRQLLGCAGIVTQHVLGTGDARDLRQVVHQGSHELRFGGPLPDQTGVFFVGDRLGLREAQPCGKQRESEAGDPHRVSKFIMRGGLAACEPLRAPVAYAFACGIVQVCRPA